MSNKKFILGICGGIGSGKSEVLKILESEGWFVIDADKVVHGLYEPGGPGQRKIADFFGNEFLRSDGSVNRNKLRKVVFEDIKKLKILNALIHPLVFSEIGRILDGVEKDRIAIEAVYFEDKYLGGLVDGLLLIERPREDVKSFLLGIGGFSERMVDNLLGVDVVPSRVEAKVVNNSTLKDLKKKVIIEVERIIS
jgi:dephospho-CoA kinase